jgi:hypothetical protein
LNRMTLKVSSPDSTAAAEAFYERTFQITFSIWLAFSIASVSFLFSPAANIVFKVVKIFLVALNVIAAFYYYRFNGITKATIQTWVVAAISIAICLRALGVYYCFGVFFLAVGRHFNLTKTLKLSLCVTIVSLAFIVMLSLIGLIPDYVEYNPSRIRHYLGFRYSLFSGQICFICICMMAVIRGKNIKLWESILCAAILYLVYEATDDRLSFWLSVLVLFVLVAIAAINRVHPDLVISKPLVARLGIWANVIAVLLFLVPILLTVFYSPASSFMQALNEFLGNRLALGLNGLKEFGLSIFGQRLELVGNGLDINGIPDQGTYNYIDSTPMLLIIRYGLIFTVGFLVLQATAIKVLWAEREYVLVFVLLVIALHSTIDDLCLALYFNEFQFAYFGCLAVMLGEPNAFLGQTPDPSI